jgi:cell wall-associated NlpC family hydrolase
MGSHRARHRSDHHQTEELATDLLARLAAESTTRPAPTRHVSRPTLDPFGTAPFPARPPRPTVQSILTTGSGATRCGGTNRQPTALFTPVVDPAPDHTPDGPTYDHGADGDATPEVHGTRRGAEAGSGRSAHPACDHRVARQPAAGRSRRLPTDPAAPFPIDLSGMAAPAGLDEATPTGRGRLAGLRTRPLYAAVSATVITATAAVAASAGPAAFGPSTAADRGQATPSASLAASAAALDLTPPTATSTPVAPAVVGGPAGLLAAASPPAVQGAAIAAQAAADAKAHAGTQSGAPTVFAPLAPAHAPKPTAPKPTAPKPTAPKLTAPKPAAAKPPAARPAPAAAPTGSGVSSRALGLARGKLGDPYVWGAAGPSAFDCSGLIVWAYKQLGISLPHSSATLSTMGTPVSKAALQPGDLVFFYSPVSHVGIYAGNGMVLNATQSGEPVRYSNLAYLPFHNARRITG